MKLYDEAEADYSKAVELNPKFSRDYFLRGYNIWYFKGETFDAVKIYEEQFAE